MKEESAGILGKRKGSEARSLLGPGGLLGAASIDQSSEAKGSVTLHVQQHPMHENSDTAAGAN